MDELKELDDEEKQTLTSLLMECAKMEDSSDKGWTRGERLKTFFEVCNAGRNNVEDAIKEELKQDAFTDVTGKLKRNGRGRKAEANEN